MNALNKILAFLNMSDFINIVDKFNNIEKKYKLIINQYIRTR